MADFEEEEVVAEREVFRGRRLTVVERDIRIAADRVVTWEVIQKDDSVAIVAIDAEHRVHLVEEYFGATGERALCLPKGRIDAGETPAEAAGRELREELGLRGDLGHLCTLSVSPGYLSQRTEIFLATALSPDPLEGDEEHSIKPVTLQLDDAVRMCLNGEIHEARTVAALLAVARSHPTP
ncbi:NUDIX domain-containing protein [Nonomuraea turkmeniaca]|uniref:NUDIX domain-containing protein n=1 Tax=Nonomuraea turkmeniaca TaxID=103838 RepID=UPI001476BF74|nr:NUDIX domain-containing protein [Nonomuraea turkmeniaca]